MPSEAEDSSSELPCTRVSLRRFAVWPTPISAVLFGNLVTLPKLVGKIRTKTTTNLAASLRRLRKHTQMSHANRGSRWLTGTGRGEEDETSRDAPAISNLVLSSPGRANEGIVEMENSTLMSTPQASGPSNAFFGTADLSRPVTRSATKVHFDSILVESPPIRTQAQSKLRLATTRSGGLETTASHLEEARDIHYGSTEDNSEEGYEDLEAATQAAEAQNVMVEILNDEAEDGHPPAAGGLCVPRRSDRIRAKSRSTRELSPSSALSVTSSNNSRVQKKRKSRRTKTSSVVGTLRRSPRLAKPLDIFHKYPHLPTEIKLMIWEAAVQPRLTYICNRSSVLEHAHTFGVQNKFPTWFMACGLSVYVARRCYKNLFGQNALTIQSRTGLPLSPQVINPSVDIVVYEPCHSGCRGFYCAQQYRQEDRAAVQRLAVQIDSPHLPGTAEPGWMTISRSWPNVETLFMMKPAVRGLDQSDKAMIRIKESDHELALRKLFDSWKKGAGQDHKLKTLEFVRVVEYEAETKNIHDRYQSVEDRKTGLVEDIVLG
ncbi:hypothetical protein F5Y10DRAFT_234752 [Nemania abortiva]|nr:hypothetical protein F5Y10DRAFT_234752 [Nemania abortiva]